MGQMAHRWIERSLLWMTLMTTDQVFLVKKVSTSNSMVDLAPRSSAKNMPLLGLKQMIR
jgi:hypothetical protein